MALFTAESPERIDTFLAKETQESRTKIQEAIKGGLVFVNATKILKPSFRLCIGDKIAFTAPKKPEAQALVPTPHLPIRIVFENNNLIVIEKPAGILSHPTFYDREGTVVNWLLAHYPDIKTVGDNPERPGLVHRLDKNTSGLMVVAKTQESFLNLKRQFQDRTIHKKYVALVVGVPKETSGIIDYPLLVSLGGTVKRKVDKKKIAGTPALTHWKTIRTFGETYALLEVEPKTGRTHQIRVHLAAIHHPVVGDPLYGGKLAMQLGLPRQFLHAYYLEFKDLDATALSFESQLPSDLQEVIDRLER
jgi:23S rRNA pseudouridine1911/1915/1917 synthase